MVNRQFFFLKDPHSHTFLLGMKNDHLSQLPEKSKYKFFFDVSPIDVVVYL